jgi:hypothetical protein
MVGSLSNSNQKYICRLSFPHLMREGNMSRDQQDAPWQSVSKDHDASSIDPILGHRWADGSVKKETHQSSESCLLTRPQGFLSCPVMRPPTRFLLRSRPTLRRMSLRQNPLRLKSLPLTSTRSSFIASSSDASLDKSSKNILGRPRKADHPTSTGHDTNTLCSGRAALVDGS